MTSTGTVGSFASHQHYQFLSCGKERAGIGAGVEVEVKEEEEEEEEKGRV